MSDELDIEVGRYALRTFKIRHGELGSVVKNHTWDGGVAIARCLKDNPCAESPGDKCVCGIYGTLSMKQLMREYSDHARKCVVVFAAEGTTYIGNRGLRTAAARIVAYWYAEPPPLEGEPADPNGPFYRAGEYLSGEKMIKQYTEVAEALSAHCHDAERFADINDMLAKYKFDPVEGVFPPPARPRAGGGGIAAPSYPSANYALGRYDKIAPHMTAATPAGIAVVKALMEGKII